ncbi:MAG: hypothetical protein IJ506_07270 [Clostridia bacterium]|nr:hypothetical protein [Clostridia bacterium]
MISKGYDLHKKGPIACWDEGFSIGNGKLGALVYGDESVCFSLDRAGLWDNRAAPQTMEKGFTYANMVRLVKSGKEEDWSEFLRLFDECSVFSTPTKINAGKLIFDIAVNENTEFFLNIRTGEVCVESDGRTLRSFAVADGKLGVAFADGDVSLRIEFPPYYYQTLGYAKPKVFKVGETTVYAHKNVNCVFGVAYRIRREKNGTQILYYVFDEKNEELAIKDIEATFAIGDVSYAALFQQHKKWWRSFWAESNVCLPDKEMERAYYLSYYFFGSGNRSGSYPMPLQGLWTACDGELPPWKGDYHHDTNTQFTYISYLRANHVETGKCFVEYLWDNKSVYERFAKDFFGVEGILVPATSTADGKPIGGWPMYTLSPTMSIWLAKSFDDYYRYTGDESFLLNKAEPFFEGVGKAISSLLQERNGKLYLPLSSSPEYGDCTREAFLEWSNNDLQLVRYLYEKLTEYCVITGKENTEYQDKLNKLDDFYIDKDDILLLDATSRVEKTHRHHSNLMCIYPLQTLKADGERNRKIIEENIKRLEELGTGLWVGFSFPWFASICSMIASANRAYFALKTFCRCFLGDNGFHLNGDFKYYGVSLAHYRPFTLEANYAYCDAIQNMLVQDHLGYLSLFPCVPDTWKNKKLSFRNFLTYNGVRIGASYENGKVTTFTISSQKQTELTIKNVFGQKNLRFSDGREICCETGQNFTLIVKGKVSLLYKNAKK